RQEKREQLRAKFADLFQDLQAGRMTVQFGHLQFQHDQRHYDGEDAVGEPFHAMLAQRQRHIRRVYRGIYWQPMKGLAILWMGCAAAAAQNLNCDLNQYRAADGLRAAVAGDSLEISWQGERNAALRARF